MVKGDVSIKNKVVKLREKLKSFSVGIAGLGGLGSNAAVSLSRAGIGKLVLVDFDVVEKNNLDRQHYFLDQVGELKVDALKQNIKKINPEVEVVTHNMKLLKGTMEKPFKTVDVVIEALDKTEMKRDFIEEILLKLPDKPLIAASGVTGIGNIKRIKTKKSGNLHLIYDEEAKPVEEDILTAPRVCLIANWQADLTLELISKQVKAF